MPVPRSAEARGRPDRHDADLSGVDALEIPLQPAPGRAERLWAATWPKLLAVAIFLGLWQVVVWTGWKPQYALRPPLPVLDRLWQGIVSGELVAASAVTMRRAVIGYAISMVVGVTGGLAVAQSRVLRAGVGSLITGLQTMPSIAWFPLAILLFRLSEQAIMFVIVLGAAPAIANGLLHGIDNVPPLLLRAGRTLGARGLSSYHHIILPAALPGFVGGMKQGWAFAWRSLMAGEIIVIIAQRQSLGERLQFAREFSDSAGLLSVMIVILLIGIVVDSLFFGRLEHVIRRRWGLADVAR